jgi:hypothetical protein
MADDTNALPDDVDALKALVIAQRELLAHERPPYCWKEEDQKQHERINGLLSVCDVTQQRYLKLPSWREEWRDRWESRRKRYLARQEAETRNAKIEV